MHALTKRRQSVPDGVVEFLRLPGIGPKTAARIWMELGVTTLDGLKAAAEEGRLRELSGLGARSEEKVLKALEAGAGQKTPAENRGLLGRALPAVKAVVAELSAHPAATAVSEAGSVRRRRETVRDLDFIATSSDAPALIAAFCEADWVAEVVARGDTKATVVGHQGLRFDLRVVPRRVLRQRPPALHRLEGSQRASPGGGAASRALDLRVRRHDRRDRGGRHARERGRALRVPRLPVHSARAARERAASSPRPASGGCRSSSSSEI